MRRWRGTDVFARGAIVSGTDLDAAAARLNAHRGDHDSDHTSPAGSLSATTSKAVRSAAL